MHKNIVMFFDSHKMTILMPQIINSKAHFTGSDGAGAANHKAGLLSAVQITQREKIAAFLNLILSEYMDMTLQAM